MSESVFLEIVFQAADWTFEGRDEVEDPLHDALENAELGEVTGGGTSCDTCNIDVEVTDSKKGLALIRKVLRALGVAQSTVINCYEPVKATCTIYGDEPFPKSKKNRKRKKHHNPGSVLQIALPDGRFAYARVFNTCTVAVYQQITEQPNRPPLGSREYRFLVWILMGMEDLPVVGVDPFASPEESDPGLFYIRDIINGSYRVIDHSGMRKSSEAECRSLDVAAGFRLESVVERIMTGKRPVDTYDTLRRDADSAHGRNSSDGG